MDRPPNPQRILAEIIGEYVIQYAQLRAQVEQLTQQVQQLQAKPKEVKDDLSN